MPTITVTVDYAIDALPSGPGYVRYQDLYRSGDTVTSALARLASPAVVTFPEGRFEESDFSHGGIYGIQAPKQCTGIWGSGQGALGSDTGTIFSVKANTATNASPAQSTGQANPFTVLYHGAATTAPVYRNFHVEGTDQRTDLMYTGMSVFNPTGAADMQGCLFTGWVGNNGAPPGETFGLAMHGSNNHVVRNCLFDGRRTIGGPACGLTAATAANSVGGKWYDNTAQYVKMGAFVVFQAFNTETFNWNFTQGDNSAGLDNFVINHERTAGTIHHAPVMHTIKKNRGVHMTHSNIAWSANYDGTTRSASNGSLTVIDPVFDDIWGNGKLYIETWNPYDTGETNTTAPTVQSHSPMTPATYKWVNGNAQTDVTIGVAS